MNVTSFIGIIQLYSFGSFTYYLLYEMEIDNVKIQHDKIRRSLWKKYCIDHMSTDT